MSSFPYFPQFVPWIAAAASVAGLAALAGVIRRLIRLLKAFEVLRAPLWESQEVAFSAAGRVVLCVEGPVLSRRCAGLNFALETTQGSPVPGRNKRFRATSSSFSTARMQLQAYDIPHAGRYVLRIGCLGAPQARDAEHAIVFTEPHLAAVIGYVLGIVAAAWLSIGGIVLFALGR